MSATADPLVVVCRDPKDHARARVRLSALDGIAFDSFSHGGRSKFSRPMLVAFMAPDSIVDGELYRPASHGLTPDRMKVAITRTHNQTLYPMLERAAAAARIAQLAPVARQRTRPNAPPIPLAIRAPDLRPHAPTASDVRAIRERTGLSPTEFADRLGMDPASVYAWEAGRCSPRAVAREKLARIDKALHPGATQHSG